MNDLNLIFDFDGTLIDSFHVVINQYNFLANEFNFSRVNESEIDNLRNMTSRELIKTLKIPLYKIPRVILRARALLRKEIKHLPAFSHLYEVLEKIRNLNINLGILTSNSAENVSLWLQQNKMQHFFDFIRSESSFFGKKQVLKKIIKAHKMNKAKTFYIGDETRDIEAAKACGIHSIAVTWGFNAEKILLQYEPDFIARKPENLLEILSTYVKVYT